MNNLTTTTNITDTSDITTNIIDAQQFIKNQIQDNAVVLFMKGTASFPQCGYSSLVVQILQSLGVSFKDIDVLRDENLRQAIKDFSSWPTIPQLYIKEEFIGGCDIVKALYQSGELAQKLSTTSAHLQP